MKIMVVGGGGREHAIIRKLKENPEAAEIYALPGNGGIAADAECVNIGAKDIDGIVRFAREKGIDRLYDDIAADNPAAGLFLRRGFTEERRTSEKIYLVKVL